MGADNKKDVNILKANRLLQAKVGTGDIDEKLVAKSQKIIEANKVDFIPLATQYINELEAVIKAGRKGSGKDLDVLQHMIAPVMQLKANAGMFNYELVSRLADIMLNFLETVDKIDEDVIDIAEAHCKSIHKIIAGKMTGDGGDFGAELVTELKDACKRYFAKQASR